MKSTVVDQLTAHQVEFVVKRHQSPALTCEAAASERHVRLSQIVKCMVGRTDTDQLVAMLIPGDRRLKPSKARKWLRAASLELVDRQTLAEQYHLVVGAISPLDLVGVAVILMDPGVLAEELVDISSGDPMAGVELSSSTLRDILGAQLVDIVSTS